MNITTIKEKYGALSLPVKASLWYTVCNVINKGLALLSTPIFTRIMTEEQYGTFSVFQSWYSILIIFTSLNVFLSGYQKGLILYNNDIRRFTSAQLGLTTTITVFAFALYILNVPFWTNAFDLPPVLMCAMFIELLLMPALELWSAQQRFDYKYKKFVALTMAMSVVSILVGVIAVVTASYKVEARVFSDVGIKAIFSGIIFALIFTGIFGMTPYTVGIILGLCGIGQYALQAEALTRSVRKMAYIENEKILGMPARHTLFGHILPNILYPMFTSMGNRAGGLTLSYASLAFIGLGVDVTSPDWGNMIYQYKIYVISNPNLILAPTLAVFLLALLFHLAFDGGASNKPEEVTIYD